MGDSAQTDPEMHSVTTQSVNLRAIEISDLEVFFSHQSDPIAITLLSFHLGSAKHFLPLTSVRPLFAHVAKHNHASLRALLRQGFILTGQQIKESEDTQALLELRLN